VEAVSGLHFFLMFLAGALLVLTRVEHPIALELQKAGRTLSAPALEYLNSLVRPVRQFSQNSVRFFTVEAEIRTLERELATLRQLLNRASDLELRNHELAKLAKLVRTSPVSAITVEVIAGPKGPFGRTVRIAAGKRDGLRYGQPVFTGDGLLGRIISATERLSQVLVLSDVNSRIPVEVGEARLPALMVGDGTNRPRLVYLPPSSAVHVGDKVVSSGASGEFLRGIHVGKVAVASGVVRVETTAPLVVGPYVTVLKPALPSAGRRTKAAAALSMPSHATSSRQAAREGTP